MLKYKYQKKSKNILNTTLAGPYTPLAGSYTPPAGPKIGF